MKIYSMQSGENKKSGGVWGSTSLSGEVRKCLTEKNGAWVTHN